MELVCSTIWQKKAGPTLSVLKEKYNTKKVVVPSVAWATDLAPVIQLGMKPILCDCNMKDLSVDLNHLEEMFQQPLKQVFI